MDLLATDLNQRIGHTYVRKSGYADPSLDRLSQSRHGSLPCMCAHAHMCMQAFAHVRG